MAANSEEVRRAAMAELARRELERRSAKPPELKSTSALDTAKRRLLGVGEAALSIGTGMVSAPINSFWNAGMEAMELPTGEPVGTYTPRTEEGRSILSGIDTAMRYTGIPQAIEKGLDLNNPDPAVRATGNLIGGVLGVLPGAQELRASRLRRAAIPTRAEIKTAAGEAYKRAEQAGGMLPQSNLGGFVQNAEKMLVSEGFDKQLNPATYAAVNRFYEEATNPAIAGHSAQGAEVLRRVLLNAEKQASPGSQDAMLAGKLVDEFDDFMDTQGLPATPEYAQARALWQTQRKAQDIENLFERAKNQAGQFSVSGMENALRTQFKQLADNPKRFGRFNAEEKAAILEVVRGGPLQNTLRFLGKFFPNGTVPAIASLSAEAFMPGAGMALAATGAVGRGAASALRNRSARRVDELVRSGAIPVMGPSRRPGSQPLPQLGYIPANALAVDQATNALSKDEERRRNALAR